MAEAPVSLWAQGIDDRNATTTEASAEDEEYTMRLKDQRQQWRRQRIDVGPGVLAMTTNC